MSSDDQHMLWLTINGFLQSVNPLLCAAIGAWLHKWGQQPPKA